MNTTVRKIIFVFFAIFVVYLPFLLKLARYSLREGKVAPLRWIDTLPSFKNIIDTFSLFGSVMYTENVSRIPRINPTNIFGAILFLLSLLGTVALFGPNSEDKKQDQKKQLASTIFIFSWLSIPIILLFIFSYAVSPVFGPVRYVLYVSCAYYLLISKGLISFVTASRIPFLEKLLSLVGAKAATLKRNKYFTSFFFIIIASPYLLYRIVITVITK